MVQRRQGLLPRLKFGKSKITIISNSLTQVDEFEILQIPQYIINTSTMEQTNMDTQKAREVMRRPMVQLAESAAVWRVRTDTAWQEYDEEENVFGFSGNIDDEL